MFVWYDCSALTPHIYQVYQFILRQSGLDHVFRVFLGRLRHVEVRHVHLFRLTARSDPGFVSGYMR